MDLQRNDRQLSQSSQPSADSTAGQQCRVVCFSSPITITITVTITFITIITITITIMILYRRLSFRPVIIFSHGLGGTFELYSALVEEWASHGAVVVCINHGDGSASVAKLSEEEDDHMFYQPVPKVEPMKVRGFTHTHIHIYTHTYTHTHTLCTDASEAIAASCG